MVGMIHLFILALLVGVKSCFIVVLFLRFINLCLIVLSLCCCVRAFSRCGKWGLLFLAARGLPSAGLALVAEHRR